MASVWDAFNRWQNYPSTAATMFAPWFDSFKNVGWINSDWKPGIDVFADVLAGLYLLYLAGSGFFNQNASAFDRSFVKFGVATGALALICYLTKHRFIHMVDSDFLDIANLFWGIAYLGMFITFLRTFLSALLYAKY